VMTFHGWEDQAAQLRRLSIDAQWDEMARVITDDILDEFCVIGTWDELPAAARAKLAGTNTRVTLPLDPTTPDEDAHLAEIIAAVKTIPALGEM